MGARVSVSEYVRAVTRDDPDLLACGVRIEAADHERFPPRCKTCSARCPIGKNREARRARAAELCGRHAREAEAEEWRKRRELAEIERRIAAAKREEVSEHLRALAQPAREAILRGVSRVRLRDVRLVVGGGGFYGSDPREHTWIALLEQPIGGVESLRAPVSGDPVAEATIADVIRRIDAWSP